MLLFKGLPQSGKGRYLDKETKVELENERVKKRQIYKYRKRILLY